MLAFARLLDRLLLTPSRNGKLTLLADFFAAEPDPDRGYALAALTGGLSFPGAKPAAMRALVVERIDPILFELSYDYVGDLAETIALIWPEPMAKRNAPPPSLTEVVEGLRAVHRLGAAQLVADWLDLLDATGRWALLKLVAGGGAFRIGAGARLAKQALADWGKVPVGEIEELWHGLEPPYGELFAWLEGKGAKPSAAAAPFRPVMLAHALEAADMAKLDPADYAVEWKWDGIRVQAVAHADKRRLFTRAGEEISAAFPDIAARLNFEATLDGELLVRAADGSVASFNDLQQRLNRKTIDRKLLDRVPAFIRAYDLLIEGEEDLRPLPLRDRRARLEAFVANLGDPAIELSPLAPNAGWEALAQLRANPPDPLAEGLMLKRWDSRYEAGRPKGLWWKWKREPHTADCVLMYAQRGHGKRSSFYSDFTFGVWKGAELVPIGKAYFGFTDAELKEIDKFVRNHTVERFGPVRAVRAGADFGLVLEIAFEGLARSSRHRAGLAMRFPRIARIRWDKPAIEADRIEALEAMLA